MPHTLKVLVPEVSPGQWKLLHRTILDALPVIPVPDKQVPELLMEAQAIGMKEGIELAKKAIDDLFRSL